MVTQPISMYPIRNTALTGYLNSSSVRWEPRKLMLQDIGHPEHWSCQTGCTVTTGTDRIGSLKAQSPISRLALSEDNLLRLHN